MGEGEAPGRGSAPDYLCRRGESTARLLDAAERAEPRPLGGLIDRLASAGLLRSVRLPEVRAALPLIRRR